MKSVLIALLMFSAPFCLALGITFPLVTFEKLVFFRETPSLVDIVTRIFSDGNYVIAAIVGLFSIVFPVAKLVTVFAEALLPFSKTRFTRQWVPILTKWSIMDIMLVALVIVAAKSSGLVYAFTEPGLWFYATSALCASLVQWLLANKPDSVTSGKPSGS